MMMITVNIIFYGFKKQTIKRTSEGECKSVWSKAKKSEKNKVNFVY